MPIRTLLVDDEPLARVGVSARLSEYPDFAVVGECEQGDEAVLQAKLLQPDLIFLDVEMVGGSGLDVAPMLRLSNQSAIVFLTAHRQYAVEAFAVEAVDYLLKPLDDLRLKMALGRVKQFLILRGSEAVTSQSTAANLEEPYAERIAVTDRKRTRFVNVGDIEWIGAAGDYTELHIQSATHLLREPLSEFLEKLPPERFCRIHRSAAVNLGEVAELLALRNNDLLVRLKGGKILRASRTFSDNLRRALHLP